MNHLLLYYHSYIIAPLTHFTEQSNCVYLKCRNFPLLTYFSLMQILYHVLFIVLQKSPEEVDQRSADMWSYAMILWELVTREVPFGHLSPMEVGMKVIG